MVVVSVECAVRCLTLKFVLDSLIRSTPAGNSNVILILKDLNHVLIPRAARLHRPHGNEWCLSVHYRKAGTLTSYLYYSDSPNQKQSYNSNKAYSQKEKRLNDLLESLLWSMSSDHDSNIWLAGRMIVSIKRTGCPVRISDVPCASTENSHSLAQDRARSIGYQSSQQTPSHIPSSKPSFAKEPKPPSQWSFSVNSRCCVFPPNSPTPHAWASLSCA